jgi:hypothetical protein
MEALTQFISVSGGLEAGLSGGAKMKAGQVEIHIRNSRVPPKVEHSSYLKRTIDMAGPANWKGVLKIGE